MNTAPQHLDRMTAAPVGSRSVLSVRAIRCRSGMRNGVSRAASFSVLLFVLASCARSTPGPVDTPALDVAARESIQERNQRLGELAASGGTAGLQATASSQDHRIGPEDLLEISVFEAPELDRSVRVSHHGEISLPLIGEVPVAGLTTTELQEELKKRLAERYLVDPHVSVQITEIQSRPISVVGAVNEPGIYQVRGTRTLIEVLALAGGLSEDAGESVLVVPGGQSPATQDPSGYAGNPSPEVQEISLRALLDTGEPAHNPAVPSGSVVKVLRSGVVYVVGEVNQPGVFPVSRYEGLTLLKAVALGEGLSPTAAGGHARIIRTSSAGERKEIRVNLGRVISGAAPDPALQAHDIVFIPANRTKAVALGIVDALVRMVTLRAVF